jgi:hypothetical protein
VDDDDAEEDRLVAAREAVEDEGELAPPHADSPAAAAISDRTVAGRPRRVVATRSDIVPTVSAAGPRP